MQFYVYNQLTKILIRDIHMTEELNVFLKEIEHYTYAEKYKRWEQYLEVQLQSDNYLYLLGIFLQTFPFNYKYWLEYIKLTKFQQYQTALTRNPKSYELWVSYLHNCKLIYFEQDQQKYKKELEKGLLEIGADSRALSLYEEFYDLVNETVRYQFYKKIFTRALIGLQSMYERFQLWFQTLTDVQINQLSIRELKAAVSTLNNEEQKTRLKQNALEIYSKTINYRQSRLALQNKIKHTYFDGSEFIEEQRNTWRELIKLERANGIVENISYCYQRSLMAQTDDVDLWEQVFHYMENETNKYTKVLNILRSNKQFFLKFDLGLYFYWCDLEEREKPAAARKMYEEISKINNSYEVYQRWIQFQIRQKQWNNAKAIFDSIIVTFQNDIELLCYILVEYSDFVVRYYKDFDYTKKLLKAYFDHLPFNNYLFTKYLQFLKNFENNEGFYEELMQFINEAIVKSKKTLNQQQFTSLIKMLKFYLRSTLGSIYLIKLSEHKMFEVEQKLSKT